MNSCLISKVCPFKFLSGYKLSKTIMGGGCDNTDQCQESVQKDYHFLVSTHPYFK